MTYEQALSRLIDLRIVVKLSKIVNESCESVACTLGIELEKTMEEEIKDVCAIVDNYEM